MRRATYVGDRQIRAEEADAVAPAPGEVQIEVAYTGICGTDLHILHGDMDARVARPPIFGHEMSGTIAARRRRASTGWAVGDAVTVMPLDWDGTCPACLAGHQHICQNLTSSASTRPARCSSAGTCPPELLVRAARRASPSTTPRSSSRPRSPCTTCAAPSSAAASRSSWSAAARSACSSRPVARHAGAEVVVIELEPAAPGARSSELGLRHASTPRRRPGRAGSRTGPAGAGADVAFEVSGAAAGVLGAIDLAKVRGTLVVVAIHPPPREVNLHRFFWRELTLLGARVYERADFETRRRAARPTASSPPTPLISTDRAARRVASGVRRPGERRRRMKILVDCPRAEPR